MEKRRLTMKKISKKKYNAIVNILRLRKQL